MAGGRLRSRASTITVETTEASRIRVEIPTPIHSQFSPDTSCRSGGLFARLDGQAAGPMPYRARQQAARSPPSRRWKSAARPRSAPPPASALAPEPAQILQRCCRAMRRAATSLIKWRLEMRALQYPDPRRPLRNARVPTSIPVGNRRHRLIWLSPPGNPAAEKLGPAGRRVSTKSPSAQPPPSAL